MCINIIYSDYNILAGRLIISNHHKSTSTSFVKTMKKMLTKIDIHGTNNPLLSFELYYFIQITAKMIETIFDYSSDYLIDCFGFKTLLQSYLIKQNDKVLERPQNV